MARKGPKKITKQTSNYFDRNRDRIIEAMREAGVIDNNTKPSMYKRKFNTLVNKAKREDTGLSTYQAIRQASANAIESNTYKFFMQNRERITQGLRDINYIDDDEKALRAFSNLVMERTLANPLDSVRDSIEAIFRQRAFTSKYDMYRMNMFSSLTKEEKLMIRRTVGWKKKLSYKDLQYYTDPTTGEGYYYVETTKGKIKLSASGFDSPDNGTSSSRVVEANIYTQRRQRESRIPKRYR